MLDAMVPAITSGGLPFGFDITIDTGTSYNSSTGTEWNEGLVRAVPGLYAVGRRPIPVAAW